MALSLFRDCEGLVVLTVQAFASLTPVLPSVFFRILWELMGCMWGFRDKKLISPDTVAFKFQF